ncbi:MAG: diguanylate cyclase [Acidimicrobiia bacterium]
MVYSRVIVGLDTSGRTSPVRRLSDALLSSDSTRAMGRLGAVMYIVACAMVIATEWMLPTTAEQLATRIAASIGLVAGVGFYFAPWSRWPRRTLLVQPLFAQVTLAITWVIAPSTYSHYMPLYILTFVFVGLTQVPGTAVRLLPITALTLLGGAMHTPSGAVNGGVVVTMGALVGELLSLLTTRQHRAAAQISLSLATTRELGSASTLHDVSVIMTRATTELLECDKAAIYIGDALDPMIFTDQLGGTGLGIVSVNVEQEQSGIGVAIRAGRTVFIADAATSPVVSRRLVDAAGVKSVFYVPLPGSSGWVAALAVGWERTRHYVDEPTTQSIELIASEAGRAIERVLAVERLQVAATTDPLTGLANRRRWDGQLLHAAVGDAIVMIDLDHFKSINDQLGHAGGDAVLKSFAATLQESVRDDDCAARYGGEEFAVLLRGADHHAVESFITRLRARWMEHHPPTTYSAGFAFCTERSTGSRALIAADEALFEAKRNGRDRVVDGSR